MSSKKVIYLLGSTVVYVLKYNFKLLGLQVLIEIQCLD